MLPEKKYVKHSAKHFTKCSSFRPHNPGNYISWHSCIIDINTDTMMGSKIKQPLSDRTRTWIRMIVSRMLYLCQVSLEASPCARLHAVTFLADSCSQTCPGMFSVLLQLGWFCHIAVTLFIDFWFLEGCIAQMTELRTWKRAWIRREKNRSSLKRPLLIGPLRKSEQEKSGHDSGSDGRKQALKSKYIHRSRLQTSVSKTKNFS